MSAELTLIISGRAVPISQTACAKGEVDDLVDIPLTDVFVDRVVGYIAHWIAGTIALRVDRSSI